MILQLLHARYANIQWTTLVHVCYMCICTVDSRGSILLARSPLFLARSRLASYWILRVALVNREVSEGIRMIKFTMLAVPPINMSDACRNFLCSLTETLTPIYCTWVVSDAINPILNAWIQWWSVRHSVWGVCHSSVRSSLFHEGLQIEKPVDRQVHSIENWCENRVAEWSSRLLNLYLFLDEVSVFPFHQWFISTVDH